MSYSLNEFQALARKAARGSGVPWGIAEEVERHNNKRVGEEV